MNYNINKVVNLTTLETMEFLNGYDLETNLISAIICNQGNSHNLLDDDYREQITKEADSRYITSKNGQLKVYSPTFDMVSYKNI